LAQNTADGVLSTNLVRFYESIITYGDLKPTIKMDSLINLYENKNTMKIVLDGKEHFVKLQGTTEEPYFCGKDVCVILGYANINDALHKHVKDKHKNTLKGLISELESNLGSPLIQVIRLGEIFETTDYHSGKAVYISEPGLTLSNPKPKSSAYVYCHRDKNDVTTYLVQQIERIRNRR